MKARGRDQTLWPEHSVWLVGRSTSRPCGNDRRNGRGRRTDVVACASWRAGSQCLLQRKQKIMINCMANVTQRIPKGYKCPLLADRIIRKAHHTYYEIWEMWGTEFSLMVVKANVPSQCWMETTGDTSDYVRSTVFQQQEAWGLRNRTPMTKESFWNGCKWNCSMGREMKGSWAQRRTEQGTNMA